MVYTLIFQIHGRKRDIIKNRLIQEGFLNFCANKINNTGFMYIVTDHFDYMNWSIEKIDLTDKFNYVFTDKYKIDLDGYQTSLFAEKWEEQNRNIYYCKIQVK